MIFYLMAFISALVAGVMVAILLNDLMTLKNKTVRSWNQIETEFKRRFDLLPLFIETVKSYMSTETATLDKINQTQKLSLDAQTKEQKAEASGKLTESLKIVFTFAENHPELKTNQAFLTMRNTFIEIDTNLQTNIQNYNALVLEFNNKIEIFPNNFFAKILSFAKMNPVDPSQETKNNADLSLGANRTNLEIKSTTTQPLESPATGK